jgi:tetratricopeptide (TPR) repeat protein/tRNA A-37 threonylcarbamoyl transferase component Bud32
MSESPDSPGDREGRLIRARAEIERTIAAGGVIQPGEWHRRHPDLLPELDTLLAEAQSLIAERASAGEPRAAGTPAALAPGAAETVASPSAALGAEPTAAFGPPTAEPGAAQAAADVREPGGDGRLQPRDRVRYIGDYEVLSVLGQGGMGVVYKARQLSLNRVVALKMIRNAEFASPEQLRRFQNEAEAVATLDHPGIVPVYEVGQHGDQRYFSMKMIEGSGLDRQLRDFAARPREGARLVAEMAEAVDHAHRRGILHRDLKPANILVDAQSHPHVTDFGLAKNIEGQDGLTVSGSIMGTPAYMAPEQALGRISQITTATDIYGLGAILYAALTGQAPFGADSVLETLEQVRQRPPEPPGRRRAGVPRDLEVICLKCLEKDPGRRYASASDLAADLKRWIHGEPIRARPVGRAVRTWMWAKRNPAPASLALALLGATSVGVVGITAQWREAVDQRNQAIRARKAAEENETAALKAKDEADDARKKAITSEQVAVAERGRAEQNAQLAGIQATLALGTVQSLITQANEKLQGPGFYDLRQGLLEAALRNVDHVAGVYDKATSKEATTATALVELGRIYRELGQAGKALKSFQKALEITRERITIKKGSDASRRNLALVYSHLGATAEELNRDMNAALDYHLKALALFEDIDAKPMMADSPMPKPLIRANLSEAYKLVGVAYYRLGRLAEALPFYRKSYNLARELANAQPDDPGLRVTLTKAALALGSTTFRTGDPKQADTFLAEALDRAERLRDARPSDLSARHNLADVLYLTGETHLFAGRLDAARADMSRCLRLYDEIAQAEPRNVYYRRDLSKAYYRLGDMDLLEGRPDGARPRFQRALEIRTALVDASRDNDRRQMELMLTQAQMGRVDDAVATADRLAAGPKVDSELRIDLARCYAVGSRTLPRAEAERTQLLQLKAMEVLRAAVKDGYRDRGYLEGEPDFVPLHDRADFRALLGEIPIPNR